MAVSKTWRKAFERIPWLTLPCACAPRNSQCLMMTVSLWLCHGSDTNWKQGKLGIASLEDVTLPACYRAAHLQPFPFLLASPLDSLLPRLETLCSAIHMLLAGTLCSSLILKATFGSLCKVHECLICKQKRSDCRAFVWIVTISQVLWGSTLPTARSVLKGTLLNYICARIRMAGVCCKLG